MPGAAINRTARLAGGLYLSLLPLGVFSFFYVPSVLLVRGDAAATVRNIAESPELLRYAVASHLASQVIFVFVIQALFRLLDPVNRDRAVLMAVLALLGIPIACLDEVHHLAVLRLLDDAGGGAFTAAQLQAQVMLLLDRYDSGIMVAQVFWGLWLLPLGALVLRSGFLPRVLGVLVIIAGAAYLFDSVTALQALGVPGISRYTFIAELALPVWLVIKGVNVERWREVAR